MLTGISPFLGEDKQETFLNISQLSVSYSDEELQQLDPAALSFIQMLLRKHPQSVPQTAQFTPSVFKEIFIVTRGRASSQQCH